MKKIIALILSIAMILTLAVSALAEADPAVKWQVSGVFRAEGEGAEHLNAAFLMNLYEDGTVEMDRFRFLAGDGSDLTAETGYDAAFMTGTWELTEKDGLEAIKIDVHCVDADGNEVNSTSVYAYENFGELSFTLTFPVVVGMSYSRDVDLEGGEEIKYTEKEAFVADYAVAAE